MRKLVYFTIGFCFACLLAVYVLSEKWLLPLALIFFAVSIGVFFLKKWKWLVVLVLGCAVGLGWYWGFDQLYLQIPRSYDEQTMHISIEATDYSEATEYGIRADGKVTLDGRSYRVRFYWNEEITISAGDHVEGEFLLRFTADKTNLLNNAGNGIYLLAYPRGETRLIPARKVPAAYYPAVLRAKLLEIIHTVFPSDAREFAKALLLGDTSGLTYQQNTDFKTAGIRHVVAVSGMHVSILFSAIYVFCRKRRILTVVVGLPVLLLFAAVAGFTPSVNRACIMQGMLLVGMLTKREYDSPTALALAVLIMVACNPLSVVSIGLQLSAGCMVGIFLFSGKVQGVLQRSALFTKYAKKPVVGMILRWFSGSVSVTLGAMCFTTPLSLLHFGSVSIIGVLTNFLTLWLISGIFCAIAGACLLGFVWLEGANALAWLIAWPIRLVQLLCRGIGSIPNAAVYTGNIYVVLAIFAIYIVFAVFLISSKRKVWVLLTCSVAMLGIAMLFSWLEPRLGNYRITVFDVGQGQAVLLQGKGETYLVDCGGDRDVDVAELVSETLLSQGVHTLDGLILTHYDEDHAGGTPYLLSRISAKAIYLPDMEERNPIRQQLEQQYSDVILWVEEQQSIHGKFGDLDIFPGNLNWDENENSLCVLFRGENCDILITGDRGAMGEESLIANSDLPKLEVLVVGHHGAETSTTDMLLDRTNPALAVISVGENTYGHPSAQVLERLQSHGCKIWRTDKQGTLVIKG